MEALKQELMFQNTVSEWQMGNDKRYSPDICFFFMIFLIVVVIFMQFFLIIAEYVSLLHNVAMCSACHVGVTYPLLRDFHSLMGFVFYMFAGCHKNINLYETRGNEKYTPSVCPIVFQWFIIPIVVRCDSLLEFWNFCIT